MADRAENAALVNTGSALTAPYQVIMVEGCGRPKSNVFLTYLYAFAE